MASLALGIQKEISIEDIELHSNVQSYPPLALGETEGFVASSIQLAAGGTAQEYNNRKSAREHSGKTAIRQQL